MDRKLTGLVATLLFALAAPASAQEFSQGMRSAGMGEAFTSISTGTSAIFHNPAGAARAVMYALEAGYEYTPTGNVLHAAIVDSKTNPGIAAGLGYNYYFGRGDDDVRGHDFRVGLAIPVLPERISVGAGGRWLIVKDTVVELDEESGEESRQDVQLMNGPTLDAGIIFKASNQFHFGIAGKNLIEQCEKPECADVAPTTITGGASFGTEVGFLATGDIGVDLSGTDSPAPDAGVGLEYMIQGAVPIRAGYQYRGALPQHLLTFGLGWRSSAAGVDVGYQIDVEEPSDMFFMGSFSIYM